MTEKIRNLLFLILFFACVATANAQDDITIPRDIAEKALTSLRLVPELEAKIKEQNTLIETLKAAQVTPCSIAVKTTSDDLAAWLNRFENAKTENRKEYQAILRLKRKESSATVARQCDLPNNKTGLNLAWQTLKDFAPVAISLAILLKK
jgi:uncharacterized coiled-coil protein SlyX